MFNLLVHGNGEAWEVPKGPMMASRFKEYSGAEADAVSLADVASLKALEDVPALLMYETGADGPNPRLVRHGRLRDIARVASELTFRFEPDPDRAYLTRGVIEEFADQLGLHRFEQHRTHWAIKDGELPAGLLEKATRDPPVRDLPTVAREYAEALAEGLGRRVGPLKGEPEAFPASTDKAGIYLRLRPIGDLPLEALLHPGVQPRTQEGRKAVERLLAEGVDLHMHIETRPFSLAWFLETYGAATEQPELDRAVAACEARVTQLAAEGANAAAPPAVEAVGEMLWRCARSPLLARRLRRGLNAVLDQLASRQAGDGFWEAADGAPDGRATAFATLALQRLGDDKHRPRIRDAVLWLCKMQAADGALSRRIDEAGDPLTTALALEAVRRSGLASDLDHVLETGEVWLLASQELSGAWSADAFDDDQVTVVVLDYYSSRSAMLSQVDGFFLMARDFFRKAEELSREGGANNRRLAAIAAVHAMEMFLYGLFERRADLGLSAYRENGVETLGPREALRMLQDSLHKAGLLVPPKRLAYRDQLTSLISRRDGIIHRAHEISEEELASGLRTVRAFVERYGAQLATLDLFQ